MSRAWTLVRGVLALVALIVVVVGLPLALAAVGGSPIPASMPEAGSVWATLTSRDDGTLLLGLLRAAAWIGWALFTMSVVADVAARARGLQIPRLGPQQALASQLVAAVVAMSLMAPTAAGAAPAPQVPAVAVQGLGAAAVPGSTASAWAGLSARLAAGEAAARAVAVSGSVVEEALSRSWVEYRVRHGDTLWDVADEQLGDPFRWPEIYAATLTVEQPDGSHIKDPDLIRPGWTLRVPRVAVDPRPDRPEAPTANGPTSGEPPEAESGGLSVVETPLTGGGTPTASTSRLHAEQPAATPLSGRSRKQAAERIRAAHGRGTNDWRDQIRAGAPELQ